MARTLAITGGTGFVGAHALTAAVAGGWRVQALARRPQPPREGVEWIAGSLSDSGALARMVAGADAVLHIAGVTNASDRAGFDLGNALGTAFVRRAAAARPLVHVSSLSARAPQLSLYGASKRQAEFIARGAAGPVTVVRPPGVYGPGDREFMALFKAAQTGLVPLPAGARAGMIYAPDLASALVALAGDLCGEGRSAGGVFDIDDGTGGYSQADIARAIAAALGTRVRIVPVPGAALALGAAVDTALARLRGRLPTLSFDRARYLAHPDWTADGAPLRALRLWQPTTGLDAGMAKTAAWYRSAGWL